MDDKIEIGNRIKEFALINYYSLTAFCEKMEISLQGIYPYINGKSYPGGQMLLKMQKLGCNIDWLLSGKKSIEKEKLDLIKKLIE